MNLDTVSELCDHECDMDNKLISPFTLLKQAWTLALQRSNIASFLVLGAFPQLISLSISAILSNTNDRFNLQSIIGNINNSLSGAGALVYIIGLLIIGIAAVLLISFIITWYTALLSKVYQATAEGNLSPISSYIRPAKAVTVHLMVTYVVVGLFTSLGLLLLIIPGIIFAYRYMFAPLIAVLEDRSVNPIKESKRLVKGRFWKLVGRSILMTFAYRIPASIFHALHPALGMIWSVTFPVFGLYFFLIYQDFKRTAVPVI